MKKLLSILLLISSIAFSQAPPQGISHRGTAYNTAGNLLTNATIKIKVSILEGASPVYSEIHTLTTNQLGQYSFAPIHIKTNVKINHYIYSF